MPLLSHAEEHELARRARAGDEAARHQLIEANMPLVIHEIVGMNPPRQIWDDLMQQGRLGLCEAAKRYDPDANSGIAFCTYAGYWIKKCFVDGLEAEHQIRVPRYLLFNRTKLPRQPKAKNIAAAERARAKPASIHEVERYEVDGAVFDRRGDGPQDGPEREDDARALHEALEKLEPQLRDVIERRAGLKGESRCLDEIGPIHGVCRERVRQIETLALKRLARMLGADPERVGSMGHAKPGKAAS